MSSFLIGYNEIWTDTLFYSFLFLRRNSNWFVYGLKHTDRTKDKVNKLKDEIKLNIIWYIRYRNKISVT